MLKEKKSLYKSIKSYLHSQLPIFFNEGHKGIGPKYLEEQVEIYGQENLFLFESLSYHKAIIVMDWKIFYCSLFTHFDSDRNSYEKKTN